MFEHRLIISKTQAKLHVLLLYQRVQIIPSYMVVQLWTIPSCPILSFHEIFIPWCRCLLIASFKHQCFGRSNFLRNQFRFLGGHHNQISWTLVFVMVVRNGRRKVFCFPVILVYLTLCVKLYFIDLNNPRLLLSCRVYKIFLWLPYRLLRVMIFTFHCDERGLLLFRHVYFMRVGLSGRL